MSCFWRGQCDDKKSGRTWEHTCERWEFRYESD
nr:MAG TPA: hypothetical protein [Caudoviricetes sp.]DAP44209.1 MAG TPA: hypothetical protein [Caudoviricetes sp.]